MLRLVRSDRLEVVPERSAQHLAFDDLEEFVPQQLAKASHEEAKKQLDASMDCLVQAMMKNKTSAKSSDCFYELAMVRPR